MRKGAYNLAQSLMLVKNAKMFFEVSLNDTKEQVLKNKIRAYIQKLNWILQDLNISVSYEAAKSLENALLNDESSLQMQNIIEMIFDTDNQQRDIIEEMIHDFKTGKIKVA